MQFSVSSVHILVWLSELSLLINAQQSISTYFMDDNCGKVINTATNRLGAFEVSLTQSRAYRRGLNCQLVVQARTGHQLMFYFSNFDIKYYSYVRGGTQYSGCIDYIALRDGPSANSPYIQGFTSGICGISRHRDDTIYNSTSQYVTISFHSDRDFFNNWRNENEGFSLVFTEFHTGTCTFNEFECPRNHRCIKGSVKCNHYNPCGDETDCGGYSHTHHSKSESGQTSGSTRSGLDVATVIGIVVSVGFLIILLVLVVAVIKTRRFQPRPRRCRRRNNISFIDVESSMSQLRLPSYEEICGATGPYVAPPPYAEQDPNKSTSSLDGSSVAGTSQSSPTSDDASVVGTSQSNATSDEASVAWTSQSSATSNEAALSGTSQSSATINEASNARSSAGETPESFTNGISQTNTITQEPQNHSNATPFVMSAGIEFSEVASGTETYTVITGAQTAAVAAARECPSGHKTDKTNLTEQNKDKALTSASDKDRKTNHEV